MLGLLKFFSLVGVVVFSILCVFASLTVKLIKKHNRSSSNRHPRAKLAFFFRRDINKWGRNGSFARGSIRRGEALLFRSS